MREERRLGWVSLSVSCHKTQTNKQPNQLAQIYPTSHQNSDLTLRLHNLQTAQFTEKLNGPLRFFAKDHRSYLRALPDTVQDLRAQRKPSFSSLPHDPACTRTGTHWFTSNGDDRRPCPHQVVNVVHNVLVLPLLHMDGYDTDTLSLVSAVSPLGQARRPCQGGTCTGWELLNSENLSRKTRQSIFRMRSTLTYRHALLPGRSRHLSHKVPGFKNFELQLRKTQDATFQANVDQYSDGHKSYSLVSMNRNRNKLMDTNARCVTPEIDMLSFSRTGTVQRDTPSLEFEPHLHTPRNLLKQIQGCFSLSFDACFSAFLTSQ